MATGSDGAIVNSSGTFYIFAGGKAFGVPTAAALTTVRKTDKALELKGPVTSAQTGAAMASGVLLSVGPAVYVSYQGEVYPVKTAAQIATDGHGGTASVPAPNTDRLTVAFP